jgi:transposase-like protein
MTESRKGISANQIKRMLGIGSYRTAWYLCHRIRAAMIEANPMPLIGIVETDETYIGKPRYKARTRPAAARVWHLDKIIVLGAVERGGKVRLQVVPHNRKGNVLGFLGKVVDDHAEAIYTDEFRSYDTLGDDDTIHEAVNHRAGEWARGKDHTNTMESVWSLLDRAIIGSYQQTQRQALRRLPPRVRMAVQQSREPISVP